MKNEQIILYPFLLILFFILGYGLNVLIIAKETSILISFFNSNFFISLVTIAVGCVAFFLYKKQKKDQKKDAAKLILQEIRYAEQQIRNARIVNENNYYLANKLLPTNSWHKNINFFVNDLLESQIDLVSQFYSQAAYLDEVISIISYEKNNIWKVTKTYQLPTGGVLNKDFMMSFSSGFSVDIEDKSNIVANLAATNILQEVSKKIEFIYNSPAVDKLRLIADNKQ